MGRFDKEVLICLDCEFTGLDPENDRIIEVAAKRFTLDGELDSFESLIDPEMIIPDSSIAIHHITQQMVVGKPKIADVLSDLLKFIGRHIVIGHGVYFDMQHIAKSAERAKIPCNILNNRYLDTLRMARIYGESPVNSLEQLRKHFNIEEEGAHRAMSDVIVNIEIFKQLVKDYKTTEELFEILSRPIQLKIMPLGKHKGRPIKDIPMNYLIWAANQEFDQDLLFSLRSEIKRRKKGGLFSQSANPFSEL